MQLGDSQGCDFTLVLVWAQLQFNQMQKYVDSDFYVLYAPATSLGGQRRELRVRGGARDSCWQACQQDCIFPVERTWEEASK